MKTWSSVPAAIAFVAALTGADVIDRIAVVVGDQVITEHEIMLELRTVALLNDKPLDFSSAARREVAERLVEQALIRREMEVSRYGPPSVADTARVFDETKKQRFKTDQEYEASLGKYGVSEDEIRRHIQWQLMTLRFIDFRFRTGIQVPLEELRRYYENQFSADWRQKNTGPVPPFEEVRDDIERIIAEQSVDQALERWLGQQRTQTPIRYQQEAFR
jgi:hypothetical protein